MTETKKENKIYFRIFAALSFLLPLIIYMLTLCRTTYTEDTGEFITGAYTLGVLHPPGYPLYTMLGKLFTFIPIGSIAWRVNFMSAFFGALASLFLFLFIYRLVRKIEISFVSVKLFAFACAMWAQCVAAEVYSLNIFFLAVCLYALQVWYETRKDKYLYILALVYGLSLTNHYFMLLAGPFFIIFILWNDVRILNRPGLVFGCIGLFLAGLLPYIYLPLAAKANPVLNWGNPCTLQKFIWHLQRKIYSDIGAAHYFDFGVKWGFFKAFLRDLVGQYNFVIVAIGILGIWRIFKENVKYFVLTIGIFIFNSLLLILVQERPLTPLVIDVVSVYYLPCWVVFAVWTAFGFLFLRELLEGLIKKYGFARVGFAAALFILMLIPLIGNYHKNDLSKNYYIYDFTKSMLNCAEKDGVIIAQGDSVVFNIAYLQQVEDFRKDVKMYENTGCLSGGYLGEDMLYGNMTSQAKQQRISDAYAKITVENYVKCPVYFVWNYFFGPGLGYDVLPYMLLYKVVKKGDKPPVVTPDLASKIYLRNADDKNIYQNFHVRQALAIYWDRMAYYYDQTGDLEKAVSSYKKACAYDDAWTFNNAGLFFLKHGDVDSALKYFERGVSLNPKFYLLYLNIGQSYDMKGDKAQALKNYKIFYQNSANFSPSLITAVSSRIRELEK